MIIAVIPARGGSKRIAKKNIKEFSGKPILAWSIEAAIHSGLFDEIVVSTDSEEIAGVARQYGASVPFLRPEEISDDYTGTNPVVKHAIQWFAGKQKEIDFACCIYATAPFVKPGFIQKGFEQVSQHGYQFAFSVTTFPFPVQRALRIKKEGAIEPVWPQYIKKRSQDLEEVYHDAGQFYWGTAAAFLNDMDLFSQISAPVVLPRYLVQDIDTLEDWMQAELMFEVLSARNSSFGCLEN
jgi:N-acylneuraminate cytidylyltransferase